jgi:hypothetical protein
MTDCVREVCQLARYRGQHLAVAAQVEFESEIQAKI